MSECGDGEQRGKTYDVENTVHETEIDRNESHDRLRKDHESVDEIGLEVLQSGVLRLGAELARCSELTIAGELSKPYRTAVEDVVPHRFGKENDEDDKGEQGDDGEFDKTPAPSELHDGETRLRKENKVSRR